MALAGCVEAEERSTNWNYLHAAIIEPSCATIGCHSEATRAAGPTIPELDLSAPDVAYFGIAGVECGDPMPGLLTEIGPEPDYPLMLILLGQRWPGRDDFPGGEVELTQMPPDSPLPPANLALIRQWLEAGAPCE
jgi:hypothetical protein